MNNAPSKRRMAENEVVFREYNERVGKSFDELKRMAKEANQESFIRDDDTPLHFYCECSDENCRERIEMAPSRYKQIHKKRDRFVVIVGHEVKDIEHILEKQDGYSIVEKLIPIPKTVSTLKKTSVDNT